MSTRTAEQAGFGTWARVAERWRRAAWIVLVVADAGLLAWGVGAALIPALLPGPGGAAILPAGYEGYTGGSWDQLVATAPDTAGYITLIFRMYGIYIIAFGLLAVVISATAFRRGERWAWWALLVGNTIAYVSAMTYDRIVGAIGPFEWSEYLGLALICGSLAATAPFSRGAQAARSGVDSPPRAAVDPRGTSRV